MVVEVFLGGWPDKFHQDSNDPVQDKNADNSKEIYLKYPCIIGARSRIDPA